MKPIVKYFFIAICISFSSNLFSQNLVAENKVWRIGAKIYSEPCCGQRNNAYKFQGDSIINDTVYAKLYVSTNEALSSWQLYNLWRETKENKIFTRGNRYPIYEPEKIMYDFSLGKNDTFVTDGIIFKVDSVLTKNWGGKLRKHWYLNPVSGPEYYKTVWIEGVGNIRSPILSVNDNVGALSFLLCFFENGQQVYQNPDYNSCFYTDLNDIPNQDKGFKIFPNPVSGQLFIQSSSIIDETYTLEIYSVKGELVKTECLDPGSNLHRIDTSSLLNGIYILRLISDSGKYDEEVVIKE
jgi:hypothetical protein